MVVSRALTQQIDTFLVAARRLARGDFRQPVPVEGHDEFAQLGREFNSMSEQLASKIEEVQRQRGELTEAIRRVGDALAMGLDRDGVVALAVRTAVDACEAEAGRARPVDDEAFRDSSVGQRRRASSRRRCEAAERRASGVRVVGPKRDQPTEDGEPARPPRVATPASVGSVHALAVPMLALPGLGCARVPRRALDRAPQAAASRTRRRSCSSTWPARRSCRSRTRPCTRRSSARR